jgi:tRNA A-37 threonylcarbamoyl transferase component Bud32
VVENPVPHYLRRPLPPELGKGRALVRLHREAEGRGILAARLGQGRAAREGRGYVEFIERDVPVPQLLLWGERRRLGIVRFGIVATTDIDVIRVGRAYRGSKDQKLLAGCIGELANLHRSGLSHGDARPANFLATNPRPMFADLVRWGELTVASQIDDLVTFLTGVALIDRNTRVCLALADIYRSRYGDLPLHRDHLLRRVEEALKEDEENS